MEPCGIILQNITNKDTGLVETGICIVIEKDGEDTLCLIGILDRSLRDRYSFETQSVLFERPRRKRPLRGQR